MFSKLKLSIPILIFFIVAHAVSPLSIQLDNNTFTTQSPRNRKVVTLANSSDKLVPYTIKILNRSHNLDGAETLSETADFRIVPNQIITQPNSRTPIYIRYVGSDKFTAQKAYRLIITEADIELEQPKEKKVTKAPMLNLKVLSQYRRSIYVNPHNMSLQSNIVLEKYSLKTSEDKKNTLELIIENSGSQQVLIKNIAFTLKDTKNGNQEVITLYAKDLKNSNFLVMDSRLILVDISNKYSKNHFSVEITSINS